MNKDILILLFEIFWIATFTVGMCVIYQKQYAWLILGLFTLIAQHYIYKSIKPESNGIFFDKHKNVAKN